jgi:hypothetical protein
LISLLNKNTFNTAHCRNCGEYGVKAAFYGKSKLYCSVACQNGIKKQQPQQQSAQQQTQPQSQPQSQQQQQYQTQPQTHSKRTSIDTVC